MAMNTTTMSIKMLDTAKHAKYGNNLRFRGLTTLFCSASDSCIKSTTSLARASMDAFIKIVEEKRSDPLTSIHDDVEKRLAEHVRDGKNVFLCGASGVGKSFILQRVMNGAIELLPEHIRSKSGFLCLIQNSPKDVYVEDYEETPAMKILVKEVSEGRRLTRGAFVATTRAYPVFKGFENVLVSKHAPERMIRLVADGPRALEAARGANGSIREFLNAYENHGDAIDDFRGPKQIMHDILTQTNLDFNANMLCEHGHMADIMCTNYLFSKNCSFVRIAHAFSEADIFDAAMYDGCWDTMYAYVNSAISIPRSRLGEPVNATAIRPGAGWTKFGNMRQRRQKLHEIERRTGLCPDMLRLLHTYASFKNTSKLIEYALSPQDFDIMNHICFDKRLKTRDVTNVKKKLRDECDSVS